MKTWWLAAVLGVAGCIFIVDPNMPGQAKVTCASSPTSCRCENKSFSLNSDESPAQNCDTPLAAGVPGCCHDLDSSGKSTSCSCQKFQCWKEGGNCTCSTGAKPSGATSVANCTETPGSVECCWGGGYSCTCQTYSGTPFQCAGGTGLVDKCPTPETYFKAACGQKTAQSCSGLSWKP